jgi:hypothetical protein
MAAGRAVELDGAAVGRVGGHPRDARSARRIAWARACRRSARACPTKQTHDPRTHARTRRTGKPTLTVSVCDGPKSERGGGNGEHAPKAMVDDGRGAAPGPNEAPPPPGPNDGPPAPGPKDGPPTEARTPGPNEAAPGPNEAPAAAPGPNEAAPGPNDAAPAGPPFIAATIYININKYIYCPPKYAMAHTTPQRIKEGEQEEEEGRRYERHRRGR